MVTVETVNVHDLQRHLEQMKRSIDHAIKRAAKFESLETTDRNWSLQSILRDLDTAEKIATQIRDGVPYNPVVPVTL